MVFVHKGYFLFLRKATEEFNVRGFSVLTNDVRGFTAVPNYTNSSYIGWSLSFDSHGFRRGKQTHGAAGRSNVVFIGDSVPFGWGVRDDGSMPSLFFERLQEHSVQLGVVNAALPSYALAQAVARYEQEVHGRMSVDTVYLQTYDPAAQLARHGSSWQPTDNWMNYPVVEKSLVARRSATIMVVNGLAWRLGIDLGNGAGDTFNGDDGPTRKRVTDHVHAELERLRALIKGDGGRRLLVAPVTLPAGSDDRRSRSRVSAVEVVNRALLEFARAHTDDVMFVDTIRLLRAYPDADVFIDRCCHLSERGNGIVAEHLMTLLDAGAFADNAGAAGRETRLRH